MKIDRPDIATLVSSHSQTRSAAKSDWETIRKEEPPNAGFSFTFDPALANTKHNNVRYVLLPKPSEEEQAAYLKMKQQIDQVLADDKEVNEKQDEVLAENFRMEADSIFRSPGGEILAVVYKDGSIHTQGGIDLNAIHQAGQGLSQHEYRAMARNAIATALGSQAVASYYDYHKPAPTRKDIYLEETAYYGI